MVPLPACWSWCGMCPWIQHGTWWCVQIVKFNPLFLTVFIAGPSLSSVPTGNFGRKDLGPVGPYWMHGYLNSNVATSPWKHGIDLFRDLWDLPLIYTMITNGAVCFVAFGQPLINAKGVELSGGANESSLRTTVPNKNMTGDFVSKLRQEKKKHRERERLRESGIVTQLAELSSHHARIMPVKKPIAVWEFWSQPAALGRI